MDNATLTTTHDDAHPHADRTEPIVIHLNVARLVHDHGVDHPDLEWAFDGSPFLHDLYQLDRRHDRELDTHRDPHGHIDPEVQAAQAAALADLTTAWQARYTAYADAFTTAVTTEAASIPGLTVSVSVEANTDPDALTDDGPAHPDDPTYAEDADPLTWRLWTAALASAGPIPGTTPTGASGPGDDH